MLAALKKDPAQRPATADELRGMLDAAQTPLGQGLPLAIFDALRPLHLDVIPIETSSELTRHYANDDPTALGRRLHASEMLLGKFEREGRRVRIHLQLIDVASGWVLWSNQFNGTANLFDMEDSVAMAVANAMRVTLNASQRASLRAVRTVNPEVHRVVVRALGYIERRDDESLHAGVDLLQDALAMDSTYAPAWAALARAHTLIGVYGDSASENDFRSADSSVDHALRLDDRLAGAHLSRAILDVFYHHDYTAASVEFQRGLALDPGDASVRLFRSWYYRAVNEPDSAIMSIRLARRLDPNSPTAKLTSDDCALVFLRTANGRVALTHGSPSTSTQAYHGRQFRKWRHEPASFPRRPCCRSRLSRCRRTFLFTAGLRGVRAQRNKSGRPGFVVCRNQGKASCSFRHLRAARSLPIPRADGLPDDQCEHRYAGKGLQRCDDHPARSGSLRVE